MPVRSKAPGKTQRQILNARNGYQSAVTAISFRACFVCPTTTDRQLHRPVQRCLGCVSLCRFPQTAFDEGIRASGSRPRRQQPTSWRPHPPLCASVRRDCFLWPCNLPPLSNLRAFEFFDQSPGSPLCCLNVKSRRERNGAKLKCKKVKQFNNIKKKNTF